MREFKRKALQVLKTHYLLLVVVCLIASFVGAEQVGSFKELQAILSLPGDVKGNEILNDGTDAIKEVIYYFTHFNELAEKTGESIKSQIPDNIGPIELDTRDGVFAAIVSAVTTGSFMKRVYDGTVTIVGSASAGVAIVIVLFLLIGGFVWFFLLKVYNVILRRIFLEARTYEAVPPRRFIFPLRVRRWMHIGWVLFATNVIQLLWCLTIVGGVIKYFSYLMVPYILAENPNVSAKEAMQLSEAMMRGHRWECFVFQLSFIGWKLLGVASCGVLDILFVNPYYRAAMCEYYAVRRAEALEKGLEGSWEFNDKYLYEKADDETLEVAYASMKEIMSSPTPEPERRTGIAAFFANVFGVVLFASRKESKWWQYEEDQIKIKHTTSVLAKRIYPDKLFPIHQKRKPPRLISLHYNRRYSIWSLIIMFFGASFVGWLWEVAFHLVEDGVFVNRGTMHGPWLPIYGTGGVLITVILYKLRTKPIINFFAMMILCGIIEYMTAWCLELKYGMRWWDYTGYFLNVDGRICAEGLLVFALGGMIMTYFVAPLADNLLRKAKLRYLVPISAILVTLFIIDSIYSKIVPNTGKGITDYDITATKEDACLTDSGELDTHEIQVYERTLSIQ